MHLDVNQLMNHPSAHKNWSKTKWLESHLHKMFWRRQQQLNLSEGDWHKSKTTWRVPTCYSTQRMRSRGVIDVGQVAYIRILQALFCQRAADSLCIEKKREDWWFFSLISNQQNADVLVVVVAHDSSSNVSKLLQENEQQQAMIHVSYLNGGRSFKVLDFFNNIIALIHMLSGFWSHCGANWDSCGSLVLAELK